MRVTSGKSRVRESRLPGSVRAKPNGRATRPLTEIRRAQSLQQAGLAFLDARKAMFDAWIGVGLLRGPGVLRMMTPQPRDRYRHGFHKCTR